MEHNKAPNFCAHCGNKLSKNDNYCSKCGLQSTDKSIVSVIKRKPKRVLIVVVILLLVLLIGAASYLLFRNNSINLIKRIKSTPAAVEAGQELVLSSGEVIKVEETRVTDRLGGGERQMWLKVTYSQPSLDQLDIKLFNDSTFISDKRYNGDGAIEFKGLTSDRPWGSYRLVFPDNKSITLNRSQYVELPQDAPTYSSSGEGFWWDRGSASPLATPVQPDVIYESQPSSINCSSSNLGSTTYTYCSQY